MTTNTDKEVIDKIQEKIARYRVDVHKPAQSPNLAEWTLLAIENIIRESDEAG